MESTLQIIQAIFNSWFVDFEPSRAKIAAKKRWIAIHDIIETSSPTCYASEFGTNAKASNQSLDETMCQAAMAEISGKSITELEQLSPERLEQLKVVADMFPDTLVESGLGEIPAGWEPGSVGDLFELHRGFDLPKKDRNDGAYPVYAAEGYDGQHDVFKMEPPGVITGCDGAIGHVYLVLENYWPLNTTLYVRQFKKSGAFYAYCCLNSYDLRSIRSGSSEPALTDNMVHSLPCFIPGDDLLDKFEQLARSIRIAALTSKRDESSRRACSDGLPLDLFGFVP